MSAEPNIPLLLASLARGDASALEPLAEAAPPEAEGPAEEWVARACDKADPQDSTAADAIAVLRAVEASPAACTIARALAHPNAEVRDAAALALGEFRYTPALPRLIALRTDAALAALEMMFQRRFFGGPLAELLGRPKRLEGRRDWSEFDAWWEEAKEDFREPPLKPAEVTADTKIADVLDRLPGSHRVLERHGFRCVARVGRDMEECVAVEKESLAEGARLHGKEVGPLLEGLAALARRIEAAERVDEVEAADPGKPGEGGA